MNYSVEREELFSKPSPFNKSFQMHTWMFFINQSQQMAFSFLPHGFACLQSKLKVKNLVPGAFNPFFLVETMFMWCSIGSWNKPCMKCFLSPFSTNHSRCLSDSVFYIFNTTIYVLLYKGGCQNYAVLRQFMDQYELS